MTNRRGKSRVRGLAKKFIFLVILATGAWAVGFFLFLDRIPHNQAPVEAGQKADAIVVLTGGGGRLEMGLRLLGQGNAGKLFISGVDSGVDKAALLRNQAIAPALLRCCIELGYSADNTFGNAAETARWMKSESFTSLYIVTANYHMPRSLVEFRATLPKTDLLPRVVHPSNVHLEDWWLWPGTIRLLATEYTKYLAANARALATS